MMDARTLRLLIADAREVGVDFVPMKIRTVEDLADLIEQQEKDIEAARKTLKDEFAGLAMNAVLQDAMRRQEGYNWHDIAKECYGIADAMYHSTTKR